jgi:protein-serine/threonine kinase
MEYMPGGELFNHLKKLRRFEERIAKFYAAEVILALDYLHKEIGVIYRDLKPENILLDEDGHIRLTDFGLSKHKDVAYSFCGTPEYLAPEVIKGVGHGVEVDWWTLGCLIYEMVVGRPPFQEKNLSALYKMIIYTKP